MSNKVIGRVAAPRMGETTSRRVGTSSLRLLSALATALQAASSFFPTSSQLAKTAESGGTEPEHVFVIHP